MDKKSTRILETGRFLLNVMVLALFIGIPSSRLEAYPTTQADFSIKITEVYYDTPGSDAEEEWIELSNFGSETLALSPFKIGDEENQDGGEGMLHFPEGSTIGPNQVIIVAQTAAAFQRLFGFSPTYEMQDSLPDVPDMAPYPTWAFGEVGLANGGDEVLLLDELDIIVDAVAFGEEGVGIPGAFRPLSVPGILRGQSIERVPAGCDTDTAVDWVPQAFPTPGRLIVEGECRPSSNPEPEELISVGEIQGRGETAEYLNQSVSFTGVVTGWIEDQNTAGTRFYTLFVQDVPGTEDGDPLTSDGIAVFLATRRPSVQPGDLVQVSGQVTEFFGLTEIDDTGLGLSIIERGGPLPEPIPLEPSSENDPSYFESLEGMLVSMDAAVVVGPTFSGCGFAAALPDGETTHYFRHQLSDSAAKVINILHTSDVDCGDFPAVQVGDRISGLSGPLHFHFDQFKIVNQETADLNVISNGLPLIEPPLTSGVGRVTAATLNMYDYFDSEDDTGDEAEPKLSAGELAIKQAKLIQGIAGNLGCPTILGVQEVEKESLLQVLAAGLVEPCGFTYQVTHLDSPDSRGIDVALLSDPRQVNILDFALRQTCSPIETDVIDRSIDCPAAQWPLFSRPPLEVETAVYGQRLTLFVNHFKSKREGEEETAARRLAQAGHIRTLVEEIVADNGSANIMVMGDFNDFAHSPVMEVLVGDGWLVNVFMVGPAALPAEEQYTYIFGGAAQFIDGILLSPSLAALVDGTMIVHSNADFPFTLGVNTSTAGLPYFFSDHDVPLVRLDFAEEVPVPTELLSATEVPIVTPSPHSVSATPTATAPAMPVTERPDTGEPFGVVLAGVVGTAVVGLLFFLGWRRFRE